MNRSRTRIARLAVLPAAVMTAVAAIQAPASAAVSLGSSGSYTSATLPAPGQTQDYTIRPAANHWSVVSAQITYNWSSSNIDLELYGRAGNLLDSSVMPDGFSDFVAIDGTGGCPHLATATAKVRNTSPAATATGPAYKIAVAHGGVLRNGVPRTVDLWNNIVQIYDVHMTAGRAYRITIGNAQHLSATGVNTFTGVIDPFYLFAPSAGRCTRGGPSQADWQRSDSAASPVSYDFVAFETGWHAVVARSLVWVGIKSSYDLTVTAE